MIASCSRSPAAHRQADGCRRRSRANGDARNRAGQKVDPLVTDLTRRVDETAAVVQKAIVTRRVKGMAIFAAIKATLGALKGIRGYRGRHGRTATTRIRCSSADRSIGSSMIVIGSSVIGHRLSVIGCRPFPIVPFPIYAFPITHPKVPEGLTAAALMVQTGPHSIPRGPHMSSRSPFRPPALRWPWPGRAAAVAAQESKSAPLAKQLAQVLDAAKLESIAAADPTTGAVRRRAVHSRHAAPCRLRQVRRAGSAPSASAKGISRPLHGSAGSRGRRLAGVRAGRQLRRLSFKPSGTAPSTRGSRPTRRSTFDGWRRKRR